MASMKEIREHIASIQSTQKVTNAMYLIASTKMRRKKTLPRRARFSTRSRRRSSRSSSTRAKSRARTSTGATRTIWPSREHTPILW